MKDSFGVFEILRLADEFFIASVHNSIGANDNARFTLRRNILGLR